MFQTLKKKRFALSRDLSDSTKSAYLSFQAGSLGKFTSFTLALISGGVAVSESCTVQLHETNADTTSYGPLLEQKVYNNVNFPSSVSGGEFHVFDGWTLQLIPGNFYLLNILCTQTGAPKPKSKFSIVANTPPYVTSLGYTPLLFGLYDQTTSTFGTSLSQSTYSAAFALEIDPVVGACLFYYYVFFFKNRAQVFKNLP